MVCQHAASLLTVPTRSSDVTVRIGRTTLSAGTWSPSCGLTTGRLAPVLEIGVEGVRRPDTMGQHGIVDIHAQHLISVGTQSVPDILDPQDGDFCLNPRNGAFGLSAVQRFWSLPDRRTPRRHGSVVRVLALADGQRPPKQLHAMGTPPLRSLRRHRIRLRHLAKVGVHNMAAYERLSATCSASQPRADGKRPIFQHPWASRAAQMPAQTRLRKRCGPFSPRLQLATRARG